MKNDVVDLSKCDDYSDQIHKTGINCGQNMPSYIYQYKKIFCKSFLDYLIDPICGDGIFTSWSSSHNTSEYWDPHNCTGSCAEPGYGCDACSNSEYFFCKKGNLNVCLHPKLECDGHPQCDDTEDENIDNCYSRYIERGIVANYATYRCPSIMYPNMITLATVCDRIAECKGDEDERNCENTTINAILFAVSMFIITVLYVLLESKRSNLSTNQENFNLRKKVSFDELLKKYSENHKKFRVFGKL